MVIIRNAYRPGDFSCLVKKESNLLADIDAFLRRHGMKPTRFGLLAVNDGRLVKRIQKHQPHQATVEKVYAFIEQYEGGE